MSRLLGFTAAARAVSSLAAAQGLAIYPAKGQGPKTQAKDSDQCHTWAVGQTGFDPNLAAPPPQKKGGLVRGGLGGAAGGALIGSLSGDAGKGAAIGGALGATVGGVRQHNQNAAAEARQEQNLEGYNRAFGACLTGRGYTVR